MLEFSSTTPEDPTRPREILFRIDGRDCTVPKAFGPIEMARYAHMIEQFGGDQAAIWALRYALGDESYLAFINLPAEAVSLDDYTKVVRLITGRLVGMELVIPEGKAQVGGALDASPTSPTPSLTVPGDASELEPPDSEVWPNDEPETSADRTPREQNS